MVNEVNIIINFIAGIWIFFIVTIIIGFMMGAQWFKSKYSIKQEIQELQNKLKSYEN